MGVPLQRMGEAVPNPGTSAGAVETSRKTADGRMNTLISDYLSVAATSLWYSAG
jgi:hypothetical protein